jgi:6-pyruvoyltetrahydropterin/6-carboxytetrahydropterin synthase
MPSLSMKNKKEINMLITKKFSFDSAHKLINYKGKCQFLHGHTYLLNVTLKGNVDKKSGMVFDFSAIKMIVEKKVLDILDHSYINDIIKQPTAENMAVWIWEHLEKDLPIYKIELWETPDSYVTYYGKNN